jgi:hypothetical protein
MALAGRERMTAHHVYLTDEASIAMKELSKKHNLSMSKVVCESLMQMSKSENEIKDIVVSSFERIEEKLLDIQNLLIKQGKPNVKN